jgi:hypothetical protein
MGRRPIGQAVTMPARYRPLLVLLAAVAVLGVGIVPAAGAATHKAHHRAPNASTAPLAEKGKGVFWDCRPKTTALLVAVNRLVLHPGQALDLDFIVKNQGKVGCDYVAPYTGTAPGPTSPTMLLGQCGSMVFDVLGAHNRKVWPGLKTPTCPALGYAQLAPGATAIGSGTWDQTSGSSSKRLAVGNYTLVIDGQFKFPLRISAN